MYIIAVYRATKFSPNATEKDALVLEMLCKHLNENVVFFREDDFLSDVFTDEFKTSCMQASAIVSMARSKKMLSFLEKMEEKDIPVLNSATAVRACCRSNIESIMRKCELHTAKSFVDSHPEHAGKGWWIKSDDTADSSETHVQFSIYPSSDNTKVSQPHIEGQCIKFYGVKGKTEFFFPKIATLQKDAMTLAEALNLNFFGGDAILTSEGDYVIIDFNDFPSFSLCREEATMAMAKVVNSQKRNY